MELRKLDPDKHALAVGRVFLAAADYVRMMEGTAPGPAQAAGFFMGVPPDCDITQSVKVGLFEGDSLLCIADMAFGYPHPGDAYIGLLLCIPEARGKGIGAAVLALLEEEARARGATRMYAGVAEANTGGRAFWMRQGFAPLRRVGPVRVGGKQHMIDRMGKALGKAPAYPSSQ